jgi:hypothetical protein
MRARLALAAAAFAATAATPPAHAVPICVPVNPPAPLPTVEVCVDVYPVTVALTPVRIVIQEICTPVGVCAGPIPVTIPLPTVCATTPSITVKVNGALVVAVFPVTVCVP